MDGKSSVRQCWIFFKHTFNRTKAVTTEREKVTPRVHARIKRQLDIWKEKLSKSGLGTQVDFVKQVSCSVSLCSLFCRCFSSQPEKWGILPPSYLQVHTDFQVKKMFMYLLMLGGLTFFHLPFFKFCGFFTIANFDVEIVKIIFSHLKQLNM